MFHSLKRCTVLISIAFAVILGFVSTVYAQRSDKKTVVTISQPFSLPGITLPAGKYVFH